MELIEYNVMNCFTTVGILFWFVRLGLQLYWNFCRQGVLEVGTLVPARYDYATVAHCLCVICWILWATAYQVVSIWGIMMYQFAPVNSLAMVVPSHSASLFAFLFIAQANFYEKNHGLLMVCCMSFLYVAMHAVLEWTFANLGGKSITMTDFLAHNDNGAIFIVAIVIFLIIGYVPLYLETWRHQGRVVSMMPVALSLGVIASIATRLSMTYQERANHDAMGFFTYVGGIAYSVTACLEGILLCSHLVWKYRTLRIRRAAEQFYIDFDELADLYANVGLPFEFAKSCKRKVDYRVDPCGFMYLCGFPAPIAEPQPNNAAPPPYPGVQAAGPPAAAPMVAPAAPPAVPVVVQQDIPLEDLRPPPVAMIH